MADKYLNYLLAVFLAMLVFGAVATVRWESQLIVGVGLAAFAIAGLRLIDKNEPFAATCLALTGGVIALLAYGPEGLTLLDTASVLLGFVGVLVVGNLFYEWARERLTN